MKPGTPTATSIGRRCTSIDQDGRVVYQHFGEGDYAQTEAKIRQLLAQPAGKPRAAAAIPIQVR